MAIDDWTQASYLKTLSEECDAPDSFEPNLTKAEASRRIDPGVEARVRANRQAPMSRADNATLESGDRSAAAAAAREICQIGARRAIEEVVKTTCVWPLHSLRPFCTIEPMSTVMAPRRRRERRPHRTAAPPGWPGEEIGALGRHDFFLHRAHEAALSMTEARFHAMQSITTSVPSPLLISLMRSKTSSFAKSTMSAAPAFRARAIRSGTVSMAMMRSAGLGPWRTGWRTGRQDPCPRSPRSLHP